MLHVKINLLVAEHIFGAERGEYVYGPKEAMPEGTREEQWAIPPDQRLFFAWFTPPGERTEPILGYCYRNFSEEISEAWQVEERLTKMKLQDEYINHLRGIVNANEWVENEEWLMVHASPKERCLAALRAVGVVIEEPA